MNQKLVEAAKEYIANGLSIMTTNVLKEPIYTSWKYKSIASENIEFEFAKSGVVGIGIQCGKINNNLEIIDVDTKNDPTRRLWEEYSELLQQQLSVYPKLVIEETVGGGRHIWFRSEVVAGNQKLAMRPAMPNEDRTMELIETRGEGGYFVAAPTEGYRFAQGDATTIPTISPEDREVMLNIARSFDQRPIADSNAIKITANSNGTDGGSFEAFNKDGDVVGLLLKHGWSIVKDGGDKIYIRRPGDNSNKSSGNYHTEKKILHVFSSSTPFDPSKGYNPVQVFTKLECGDDFAVASKKLSDLGYGDREAKNTNANPELSDDFSNLLEIPTEISLRDRLRIKPPSILTSYTIGGEHLYLPSGAITIVCAPTAHGKTTSLINIALDIAQNMNIYYFGYEESADSILINAMNTFISMELGIAISKNSRRTIKSYLTSGTTKYLNGDGIEHPEWDSKKENRDLFIAAKDKFFKEIIATGRFRINYSTYNSAQLSSAIKYLKNKTDVGAIFIDYIQLINPQIRSRGLSRQEQIKQVCLDLKDAAVATGLPLIIGAQFNREVVKKDEMDLRKIGEAGDIERIAHQVIGCYLTPIADDLNPDAPSQLFVKILKNRDGKSNLFETMAFDGNRGLISNKIAGIEKKQYGF